MYYLLIKEKSWKDLKKRLERLEMELLELKIRFNNKKKKR
jgi:hypothetical protein